MTNNTGKRERIAWDGFKNLQIVEYFIGTNDKATKYTEKTLANLSSYMNDVNGGKRAWTTAPKQAGIVKKAAIAFVQALKREVFRSSLQNCTQRQHELPYSENVERIKQEVRREVIYKGSDNFQIDSNRELKYKELGELLIRKREMKEFSEKVDKEILEKEEEVLNTASILSLQLNTPKSEKTTAQHGPEIIGRHGGQPKKSSLLELSQNFNLTNELEEMPESTYVESLLEDEDEPELSSSSKAIYKGNHVHAEEERAKRPRVGHSHLQNFSLKQFQHDDQQFKDAMKQVASLSQSFEKMVENQSRHMDAILHILRTQQNYIQPNNSTMATFPQFPSAISCNQPTINTYSTRYLIQSQPSVDSLSHKQDGNPEYLNEWSSSHYPPTFREKTFEIDSPQNAFSNNDRAQRKSSRV